MTRIILALIAAVTSIIGLRTGVFHPLLDWIKSFITEQIPSFVWSILPSGLTDLFNDIDLDAIASVVVQGAWFIPFWPVLSIYLIGIGLASAVLLVRYIIGFIPTVDG